MKITLFTSNKNRHNYLINLLSKNCEKLYVVQENNEITKNIVPKKYPMTDIMKKYFKKVHLAQLNFFANTKVDKRHKNIKILKIQPDSLNKCSLKSLSVYLNSDIYIVFGGPYIKGPLVNFLIKKKTINIHMGISPYYRGTDCNFWALYDNNPHLVGATIHMLSKGLDNGPIIYHALSKIKNNPFDYTMSCVKAAFYSLSERIKNETIFKIKPQIQIKKKQIRYSKRIDFNEITVENFFSKKINLNHKPFDFSLLKDPFFLEK